MSEAAAPAMRTFPIPRTCPFASSTEYAELRDKEPISRIRMPHGTEAWLITKHEHAQELLVHPNVSKNFFRPGYPAMAPQQSMFIRKNEGLLVPMDPPEHAVYRRMLAPEFSVPAVQKLRPYVEQLADEHIDAMLGGERPVDLVAAFALPIPALTVCHLLGIPYEGQRFFQIPPLDTPYEERRAIQGEVRECLAEHMADRVKNPRDDALSRLAKRYHDAGFTDPDTLNRLGLNVLLGGGRLAVTAMISLGVLALLEHPEQRAQMVADPAIVPAAVEEMIRWLSVSDTSTNRIATADIEIGGVLIKDGDGIVIPNDSANHDPDQFERPEELDVNRDARSHLAFGDGVHQCIGQHLCRMILEVAYPALFRRIPGLRLAQPLEGLPFEYGAVPFTVRSALVTW